MVEGALQHPNPQAALGMRGPTCVDCRIHVPAGEADERGRVLLCEILENTVMVGVGLDGIGRGTRKPGRGVCG